MKLYAGLIVAAQATYGQTALGELVDNWCGSDLNEFYNTTGLAIEYR